jgi:peptidoglycan/xylan/chitin deacetylase (PgdA/CDA1 family)
MKNRLRNNLGNMKARLLSEARNVTTRTSRALFPGTTALLYHRVTKLAHDPQLLAVTPEHFEQHLLMLKKKSHLLTIDEFGEILESGKPFPRNSFIITFDDGYSDNAHEALPILEALDVQALFFVSTAHLETPYEFWWDNLERIFLKGETPKELTLTISNNAYRFPTATPEARVFAYRKLHKLLKPLIAPIREKIIEQLLTWASTPLDGRGTHRSMTKAELKKCADSPSAHIGAHTHTHAALSGLSFGDQLAEISKSKEVLEEITGKKLTYFSYPFGGINDFADEAVIATRQTGFTTAFANMPGIIRKSSDRFRLPRVLVRDWNVDDFSRTIL